MQIPSKFRHGNFLRLALVVGGVAALVIPVVVSAYASPTYALAISHSSDRSSAAPLAGARIGGTAYIFIAPSHGVTRASFWLDNPAMTGKPANVDTTAPFDFVGTRSSGKAMPWSASSAPVGTHRISVRVATSRGTTSFTTEFTVARGVRTVTPSASTAPGATSAPTATPTPGVTPTPAPATPSPSPVSVGVPSTPRPTSTPAPIRTPAPTAAPTAAPTPKPTPRPTAVPTATPPASTPGWTTVVDDQFNSGGVPSHWAAYDGPYGSGVQNCAAPSQDTVSGGYLHLTMAYRSSGNCGAGWYTGGLSLDGFSSVDQRVTVRLRVIDTGNATSHLIIPMRWPDDNASWPTGGEEDYFEGDSDGGINTFLHYGSNNAQVASPDYNVDLSTWHTIQVTRLNHVVTVSVDGSAWTYSGSQSTLPDTLKHVVLQQECHANGCPSGTSGTEDLQIDWITIENPS